MNFSNCCELLFVPGCWIRSASLFFDHNKVEVNKIKELRERANIIGNCQICMINPCIAGIVLIALGYRRESLICLLPMSLIASKAMFEVYKIKKILDSNEHVRTQIFNETFPGTIEMDRR